MGTMDLPDTLEGQRQSAKKEYTPPHLVTCASIKELSLTNTRKAGAKTAAS